MSKKIRIVYNTHRNSAAPVAAAHFDLACAEKVQAFHRTFPEYAPTPLADLSATAAHFGAKAAYVKDESPRFGLNAFKGLGGSFCLGHYIADRLERDIGTLSCAELCGEEVKAKRGQITFVTATDGNHGRGIAWTAAKLGQKAVVYMPHGSAAERLENIRALGAEAEITPWNYDDTVRFAKKQGDEKGWVLVQDTAWPGYEAIPTYIMQGYLTMAKEAADQLGDTRPTHVFLQAGVGAMAGAVCGYLRSRYGDDLKIIIVEPDKADCMYQTALADDGSLHMVGGALDTIMAGLACGEPCTIGWQVLHWAADAFISMEDAVAADGMRILGNPAGKDDRGISGESGAAGDPLLFHRRRHRCRKLPQYRLERPFRRRIKEKRNDPGSTERKTDPDPPLPAQPAGNGDGRV